MEIALTNDINYLQREVAYNRNETAYKLLFLKFYKRLTGFAFTFVKSKEAAEEIVSDVMLNIWTMREKLADVVKLDVYLFTATRNTSINYLSKHSKYTSWDIDNIPVELDVTLYNLEDAILQAELRKKITAAVHSLPPKCQMAYKLVREEGFTYKQVAAIMEISENTVDRHLNIAMEKLTASVKGYLQIK